MSHDNPEFAIFIMCCEQKKKTKLIHTDETHGYNQNNNDVCTTIKLYDWPGTQNARAFHARDFAPFFWFSLFVDTEIKLILAFLREIFEMFVQKMFADGANG